MDGASSSTLTAPKPSAAIGALNAVFGSLRAEYLNEDIYEMFTQPSYWPELLTVRPCMLVGGRGTGKTTVLRSLSYQGQSRLNGSDLRAWPFIGVYYRVDTNVVAAFRGAALDDSQWGRLFSHYLNLILVGRVLEFCQWHMDAGGEDPLTPQGAALVATSLNVAPAQDVSGLAASIDQSLITFEGFVNNAGSTDWPLLSMQGKPLELLVRELQRGDVLGDRPFCVLIDEFENLENHQQRILNTLIKHSSTALSYKVGMKTTGHREHATLNENEQLMEPADYALIDISPSLTLTGFSEFAERICNARLARLFQNLGLQEAPAIRTLFPRLSESDEADILGLSDLLQASRDRLVREGADAPLLAFWDTLDELERALVAFWAKSKDRELLSELRDRQNRPQAWRIRRNNYQYAMLFTLRHGKRGIRKYYCGWDTFVSLADGNIRFLLFLVTTSLQRHLQGENSSLAQPVSPRDQTFAAQEVGRRIVHELQGLAAEGAQLTRLVLSLGRIYGVMTAQPHGHAPEVNQFRVAWDPDQPDVARRAGSLLAAAVMHLAVVRFPGDKAASASSETKDYDYALHPIFAPFFVFSHRSKRRITLAADELLLLALDPATAIRTVLNRNDRAADADVPEQLELFRSFYG